MLILSRDVGEKLFLFHHGAVIEICLVGIKSGGNSAKLGVKANNDVHVVREELIDQARPPKES